MPSIYQEYSLFVYKTVTPKPHLSCNKQKSLLYTENLRKLLLKSPFKVKFAIIIITLDKNLRKLLFQSHF